MLLLEGFSRDSSCNKSQQLADSGEVVVIVFGLEKEHVHQRDLANFERAHSVLDAELFWQNFRHPTCPVVASVGHALAETRPESDPLKTHCAELRESFGWTCQPHAMLLLPQDIHPVVG